MRLATPLLLTAALWAAAPGWAQSTVAALPTITVAAGTQVGQSAYEGQVEAVRQTVIAAQVPGSVVQLHVKAGERVKAGQVLARIDARAADQNASASSAQVAAAQAQLALAAADLQRKQQLHAQNYLAKAALEQSEAAHRAAQAQVKAMAAQAGAAQTQSGFAVVRAPYDGVVANVQVELGDMAMPGRPLLTVYDPAALRVAAFVPAATAAALGAQASSVRVQVPELGDAAQALTPTRVQVLPTVDAQSMTRQVRADLPALATAVPGQFARLLLPSAPTAANAPQGLRVPLAAIVRRAEMTGVYVLGDKGQPLLRQVRLGPVAGDSVEVLAGVRAGDKVVTDPARATAQR